MYAGEDNFLLGAFLLADLGVAATRGALPLLATGAFQEAGTGLLAAQAYHAGVVRTMLLGRGLEVPAGAVADARAGLGGRPGWTRASWATTGGSTPRPPTATGWCRPAGRRRCSTSSTRVPGRSPPAASSPGA